MAPDALRAWGLSAAKTKAIRAIAQAALLGDLDAEMPRHNEDRRSHSAFDFTLGRRTVDRGYDEYLLFRRSGYLA